jgi:glyoxylase-like metal-dependent hydrolase (beta-lactamase superfamily II)
MIKKLTIVFIPCLAWLPAICQNSGQYQVFAIKFRDGWNISAQEMIDGANPKDSVSGCNMVWLLKGENGKNILVDAGYLDTSKTVGKNYVRPDLVLQRIKVSPDDITDLIITHPHFDHIGGINLFPKAKVWIQKDDFDYFVGESWQESGNPMGFEKNDVRNLIEINLQGRLKFVKGDNIEIIPGIRVFTGSKHTFENQYLLVNSKTDKVLIASDAIWFYYNLDHLLPARTYVMDSKAYVEAMKRMKTLVTNPDLIIPGHDDLVFSRFPTVAEWSVKIGN